MDRLLLQAVFGPDVISRIIHCQRDPRGGAAALQERAAQDINRLTDALLEAAGLASDDIWGMVVSGNTTMVHLLLGLEPAWIRRDPFVGCASRVPPVRPALLTISSVSTL